ncbi:MAG: tripartite tricarboxylate transporter substrate-binding protein [Burkholderiales bacterium]
MWPATVGKLRPLAISSPQRLGGVFSIAPTWKEQGVNAVSSSWRGLMGPRGMTAEQIAYWDRVFAALVKTDGWKKDLEENFWDEGYADAKSTRKRLDDEYAEYKAILTELGVAK